MSTRVPQSTLVPTFHSWIALWVESVSDVCVPWTVQHLFLPLTQWLLGLEHLLGPWLGLGSGWMDCSTVLFSLCLSLCPQLPHRLGNSDLPSAWRSPVLWRACRRPCQRSTGTTNCSHFTARVKTWFGDEAAMRASEPLLINHMMGPLKMTTVGDEEADLQCVYCAIFNYGQFI